MKEPPKKIVSAELKVLENRSLGGPTRLLALSAKDLPSQSPHPFPALGRFARLRAWAGPPYAGGPLLDRPFSIHRADEERVEFLIRAVGQGTSILGSLAPGSPVGLIGPLGRGLDAACPDFSEKKWHLLAGGAGLGPMGSIAEALGSKASLFYGERTAAMAIDCSHLSPSVSVTFATEDGSGPGPKGLATEPLAEALKTDPRPLFACGPNPMLKAAYFLGKAFSVPVLVCLEARMACGLGACLSCAVPKKGGGYLRACLEGPVMDASLIDWEAFS